MPRVYLYSYLHYAELTGYELNLSVDVAGQPLSSDKTYMYDINERGLRRADQGEISADHIKLLRILMTKPIESAAQIGGIVSVLPDVWLITRQHASV